MCMLTVLYLYKKYIVERIRLATSKSVINLLQFFMVLYFQFFIY